VSFTGAGGPAVLNTESRGIYNVKDYGAAGDESIITTGSITNGTPTLVVASATGLAGGRYVTVAGAGAKTTTGSITVGTNQLTLASSAGFVRDTYITIVGAGAGGANMYAQIRRIVGNVLTMSENAGTTVAGANVTNDGVLYDAKILSIAGTTVTLNVNASATVAGATVQIDDQPAFVAAMEAMRTTIGGTSGTTNWYSGKLLVPPGASNPSQAGVGAFFVRCYRLSRPLHIRDSIILEGANGTGDHPICILRPDLGVTGVIFDCPTNFGLQNDGFGSGAIMRNLAVASSVTTFTAPISGGTVPKPIERNTAYTLGAVRVPSSKRDNDFGAALKCIVAGTTGAGALSEPNWNSAGANDGIYVDGTVTWKMIDAHGVFIEVNGVELDGVWVGFVPGYAFNNTASSPQAIGNIVRLYDCTARASGGGWHAHGNDANQGILANVDVVGTYGWEFCDDTLLGNRYYACHGGGQSVRGGYKISRGNCFGCYEEQGNGPIYLTPDSTYDCGIPGDGFNNTISWKTWAPNTVYPANQLIVPTVTSSPPRFFRTFGGGTSGGVEPTWANSLGRGDTITDNSITWYCYGDPTLNNAATSQNIQQSARVFASRRADAVGKAFFAATANSDEFFGWSDEQDDPSGYNNTPGFSWRADILGFGWNGPDYGRAGAVTNGSFVIASPRAVTASTADFTNQLRLPHKHRLGNQYASEIHVDVGTNSPATDAVATFWLKGSIRWNANVAVGQPTGWRCTVTGTPGTWVAMANL
jgi:hypothetical protein